MSILWMSAQAKPIRVYPVAVELNNLELAKIAVRHMGNWNMRHPCAWSTATTRFLGLRAWHAIIVAVNAVCCLEPSDPTAEWRADLTQDDLQAGDWEAAADEFYMYVHILVLRPDCFSRLFGSHSASLRKRKV